MNFLSNLPKIVQKKKKRLGRGLGSTRGAKSGRGTTRHQSSRENIPLHFEGGQGKLTKRYPLLRGKGKNKSVKQKPIIISFDSLSAFKSNEIVTIENLIEKKIVDVRGAKLNGVKLLNRGKLEKKLTIKIPTSDSVKKIVEKLGGTVDTV